MSVILVVWPAALSLLFSWGKVLQIEPFDFEQFFDELLQHGEITLVGPVREQFKDEIREKLTLFVIYRLRDELAVNERFSLDQLLMQSGHPRIDIRTFFETRLSNFDALLEKHLSDFRSGFIERRRAAC